AWAALLEAASALAPRRRDPDASRSGCKPRLAAPPRSIPGTSPAPGAGSDELNPAHKSMGCGPERKPSSQVSRPQGHHLAGGQLAPAPRFVERLGGHADALAPRRRVERGRLDPAGPPHPNELFAVPEQQGGRGAAVERSADLLEPLHAPGHLLGQAPRSVEDQGEEVLRVAAALDRLVRLLPQALSHLPLR